MRFFILFFVLTSLGLATGVTTSRRNVFNALQTMKQGLTLKNSDVTVQSEPGDGTVKIVIKNGDQEYHLKIDGSADDAFKITDGTSSVDVFHITAAGLVGIGNITPLEDLHLSAATPTLRLTDTGGGYTDLDASSGFFVIEVDDNNNVDDSIFTVDIDGTEQIRITTGGLMSIGNIAPLEDLHLSSATPTIRLTDTGGGYVDFDANGGNLVIEVDEANTEADSYLSIELDSTEYARVSTTGFGIATTAPGADLHVANTTTNVNLFLEAAGTSDDSNINFHDGAVAGGITYDHGSNSLSLITAAAPSEANADVIIDSSGNMGIGTGTPGYKLEINGDLGVLETQGYNQVVGSKIELGAFNVSGVDSGEPYRYRLDFSGTASTGGSQLDITQMLRGGTERDVVSFSSSGNVGIATAVPHSLLHIEGATESIEFVDAGSASATEQDWIEVQIGDVVGYIRVFSAK